MADCFTTMLPHLITCDLGEKSIMPAKIYFLGPEFVALRVCEKIRSWFDTLTTNGMR